MYLTSVSFERDGVKVSLVVTEMIANSENSSFAPEFVVTDGEFKDKKYRGNTYMSPPVHEVSYD